MKPADPGSQSSGCCHTTAIPSRTANCCPNVQFFNRSPPLCRYDPHSLFLQEGPEAVRVPLEFLLLQDHALLFRYHQPEIRCFHHGFQLAVIKQPRFRQLHSLRYRVADPLRQEEQCFRLGIPLEIPGMAEQIPGSRS